MKQILIFIFTFLCTTFLTAQSQDSIKKSLIIGEVRTIKSKLLNEDRILNIYLPLKYDATKSYPVIYLLDGSMDEDFLHLTGLVQFFNMQFKMPDFIVVGVANVDRKRDFTFHTDLKDLQKEYPTTGHSDVFIKFIEEELQPFIRENYHTNETKYIIGQSLGGLLATEILLKKPTLFSHYLIVSPSLWWDNESLLKEAKSLIEKQTDGNLYVYISVGNGEAKIMQRDATELFKLFKDANKKSTVLDFKLMMDENHATILHNSIYQAFLKLFPFKE
jgi:predicted alpha/beta superfamily hydrolase